MVAAQARLWAAAATILSLLAPNPAAAVQPINPALCHCYLTNGTTPQFLVGHRFFDFRNIANPRVPATINDPKAALAAPVTHPYFNSTAFADTWSVQAWVDNGTIYNTYSKNDVFISPNTDNNPASRTYLSLRTYRHPVGNFQSSAEIQSLSPNYKYLSMRMYARTRGPAGAVAAMFTYRGGNTDADVQEADLEILTRDAANQVHYTNQPSSANGMARPNATRQVTIPGVWSNWRVHRYDWSPGSSDWYVDGRHVGSIQYQTPRDPVTLLFNTWSDGASWSGLMASGRSAQMDIQWIDIIYNNTAQSSAYRHCSNVCSLDLSRNAGTPVLDWSGP
ncbi:glycoside hydrolase family 16 protein [Hypoxylon sp. NC1633]|nr:glycoside hydrolase family 16 protein [Hypoxylon sp. NC1633]